MKKFNVELIVFTRQSVWYEVEAESKKDLKKILDPDSLPCIGRCVQEEVREHYDNILGSIVEVKNESK